MWRNSREIHFREILDFCKFVIIWKKNKPYFDGNKYLF